MVTVDATEIQLLKAIGVSIVIGLFANSLFYILGFYAYPKSKNQKEEALSPLLILKAFVIFLVSPLVIIPSITSLWYMINGWELPDTLPIATATWLHLIGVWLTLTLFSAFLLLIDPSTRKVIFGSSNSYSKNIGIGISTWFVAYPSVLVVGNILAYGIYKIFGEQVTDQVVITKLKESSQYPILYPLMTFTIIIIVPFLEELLFRGFLQTWIRQYAGKAIAIITTSIIFSLFHYSGQQGNTNIQLVISLFTLSCYLGFLRERQQSIWASIGLHSAFNGMSIFILHLSELAS